MNQLDALNQEYIALSAMEPQPYVIGGSPNNRWADIIAHDVEGMIVGATAGALTGNPMAIVTAGGFLGVGASLLSWISGIKSKAVIIVKRAWTWITNLFSSGGKDEFTEIGIMHNKVIMSIQDTYTDTQLQNMSDEQLFNAILTCMSSNGYDTNAIKNNLQNYYMEFINMKSAMVYDNPNKLMEYVVLRNPTKINECSVVKSYINTLNQISESNLVNYNISFNNTVKASNISAESKTLIQSCSSVGLASSNLWYKE